MEVFNRAETKDKRRALRKNQTDAEKKLWHQLRNKQCLGYKFFRQYSISNYIVDFYCPQLKLVIELDGSQHYTEQGKTYDKAREKYMLSLGIKTLRFSNLDILKDTSGVMCCVAQEISVTRLTDVDNLTPPNPLFQKRGGIYFVSPLFR